ncbi:MAG: hypothetical protein H6835_06020 [Planctomycetes bacterium]|nr:hypothetical protein [Planctomycetota bacterium]
MKRTIVVSALWMVAVCGATFAQDPASRPGAKAQVDPVDGVAEAIAAVERSARSLRMELSSRGRMPGGLEVSTRGELRVLRETQPDGAAAPVAPLLYSRLEYSFGEGLTGRVESAQTAAGVMMFEEDPAFGAVLLRIPPAVVGDLEWAGRVLQRADLPGMGDSRARAPLGSQMLVELGRAFTFTQEAGENGGVAGTWLRGKRKPGLDDQDPDLPLADRVEVFVGAAPRAVRTVRHYVGEDVVQELDVTALELGVELGEDAFAVDAQDLRPRDVKSYQPMWEQIEQTLLRAAVKSGEVRPSSREKQLGTLVVAGKPFLLVQLGELMAGVGITFEAFAGGLASSDLKQLEAHLWIEAGDGTQLSRPEKGVPGGDRLTFQCTPTRVDAAPLRVVMSLRRDGRDARAELPLDGSGHRRVQGPHRGVAAKFGGGGRTGHLELELHADDGSLELWLAADDKHAQPFDLPLDAAVEVEFAAEDGRKLTLHARNSAQNEGRDGKPNVRGGKTNYFVFPGPDGESASWLKGPGFQSVVTVRFVVDGQTFTSEKFVLDASPR